ncbi:hypothetical protein [Bradyrhizobium sp. 138]|nr:hypothetical protein [Bradyrhizobium sp. 138]
MTGQLTRSHLVSGGAGAVSTLVRCWSGSATAAFSLARHFAL